MTGLVDKKIVLEKDLNVYIQTNLEGWKKTKHDLNINDMIFENNRDICFIYRWGEGFLIQKIEG